MFTDFLNEAKENEKNFRVDPLNYKVGDLAPTLSKANVESHLVRTKGYARDANIGGNKFAEGGIKLHNIWWKTIHSASDKPGNPPFGEIEKLIIKKYDTVGSFKEAWKQTALQVQGSGWIVMLKSGKIMKLANHTYVDGIVMILDVWEHAYVVDYDYNKSKYIDKMWNMYNWEEINNRL